MHMKMLNSSSASFRHNKCLNYVKIIIQKICTNKLKNDNIDKYNSFFRTHITKEGNYFVASIVLEAITIRNERNVL